MAVISPIPACADTRVGRVLVVGVGEPRAAPLGQVDRSSTKAAPLRVDGGEHPHIEQPEGIVKPVLIADTEGTFRIQPTRQESERRRASTR